MDLVRRLERIWLGASQPFLIHGPRQLSFEQVMNVDVPDLSRVRPGDVVALVGDFEPTSIRLLLELIERRAILVPLTQETAADHAYFFEAAHVGHVVRGTVLDTLAATTSHPLLDHLRVNQHAGLVLFSTGTTGRPKAILHDMSLFLRRFETPRPALRTLGFLLFDHIGGLNTLLHTLFNRGVVITPTARTVQAVLEACRQWQVEVLPTTPTFLRMLLMGGVGGQDLPPSLKLITYGTERMDEPTLGALCELFPQVDFRQTFGMSELGIMRVKSRSRSSLFMKVGGEGVQTRIVDGVLHIRSETRMMGYLNAPQPFDEDGWYDTKDRVEEGADGYFQVIGRQSDVINVGGLKFMGTEVERVALEFPGVGHAKVLARSNPITGQHVELTVEPAPGVQIDRSELAAHLRARLQSHMQPKRIAVEAVRINHRFKKS